MLAETKVGQVDIFARTEEQHRVSESPTRESRLFFGEIPSSNPNPVYTCTSALDAANHARGAKASLITVFCHAIL